MSPSPVAAPAVDASVATDPVLTVHPETEPPLGPTATLGPTGTSSEAAGRYLARRMGYREADGAARLLAELEACRARIRATFDECFRLEMSRDG